MKHCNCKSPYCKTCENKRIVETGVKMIIELNAQSVDLIEKAKRPNEQITPETNAGVLPFIYMR